MVETRQERLAQGKPVGRDVPYAAMGGLTGFSSLAEGYMRLDDSGIGKWGSVSLARGIPTVTKPYTDLAFQSHFLSEKFPLLGFYFKNFVALYNMKL